MRVSAFLEGSLKRLKMKFGKELEQQIISRWRHVYIDYKRLKKLLKARPVDTQGFLIELQKEIDKVNTFVLEQKAHIAAENQAITRARGRVAANDQNARSTLLARARAIWQLSEEMTQIVETCYTAVYKAIKKHDKVTKQQLQTAVLALTDQQPFMQHWLANGMQTIGSGGGAPAKPPKLLDALGHGGTFQAQSYNGDTFSVELAGCVVTAGTGAGSRSSATAVAAAAADSRATAGKGILAGRKRDSASAAASVAPAGPSSHGRSGNGINDEDDGEEAASSSRSELALSAAAASPSFSPPLTHWRTSMLWYLAA